MQDKRENCEKVLKFSHFGQGYITSSGSGEKMNKRLFCELSPLFYSIRLYNQTNKIQVFNNLICNDNVEDNLCKLVCF